MHTVLIVDNLKIIRDSIKSFLEDEGFSVVTAASVAINANSTIDWPRPARLMRDRVELPLRPAFCFASD